MRKRIAALFASAFVVSLFMGPVLARAYADMPATAIFVNNVDITKEADRRVECGDGYAEFNPETGVLTLNNAAITETYFNPNGQTGAGSQGIDSNCGIYSGRDVNLVIELVGDNAITSGIQAWGIDGVGGDITIRGEGSLSITANKAVGINASRELTVSGATVRAISGQIYTIQAQNGPIHITNGAHVEAAALGTDGPVTLRAQAGLAVDNGAVLEVDGRIWSEQNAEILSGATLTVLNENLQYGLRVDGDMSVQNATVTITSFGDYGIAAKTIKVDNSLVTFSGAERALFYNTTFDFDGKDWYQWATSPVDEVKPADDSPYPSAGASGSYLRFEPEGTAYALTVENGKGGGSYVAGTKVTVSSDAYTASGHFDDWTITKDPTGAGALDAADTAEATFTMPAGDVTLTANYANHDLSFKHHAAKAPTCTEAGWEAYDECACGYSTYKEIPAVGHDWGDPKWSWSEDGTEFVATFACASNPAHTKVLTARPTSTVQVEPTCTEPGVMLYHATVELDGVKYEATATAELPAAGHDFADGACAACGAEDPEYVAPEPEKGTIPAAGDTSVLVLAAPALVGASALAAGTVLRRRR